MGQHRRPPYESGDIAAFVEFIFRSQRRSFRPDLAQVPLTFDLIKNEEGKQLLRAGGLLPSTITRVYATTPGTPKDRVKLLQNGFAETLKDKAFMADAEKAKLETDPLTGEQVAKAVAEMFNIDESLQTKQNDSHVKVIGARWPIGVASYLSGATPVF